MPFVEGVGLVDVSSSKVLATVSRGRFSHSTVESQLKSALSDSNIAWENSLCIATPIHVVAITQARRRAQRQLTSNRRRRGGRCDEDDYMNVEDAQGDSSLAEDECDWETYVFPILDRCSKVVLAACGPKPTVVKIEKNFAAVYLGLMKVLVLGCDGVSTTLAVNKRASGLMPWPSSSKSKADDHPLLSATALVDDDEVNNKKNNGSKAESIKFMLESASISEQIRLDLPRTSGEANGQQANVTSDFANELEDVQLLSVFGTSFLPPPLANSNNVDNEDEEEEDSELDGAFNHNDDDNEEEENGIDYDEEEDDERNSQSTEEKEFIDGQPRGNYSRIKVATPTRKRRTLSTGARERLREENERARSRGEGKSGEDGPLRKKASSSLEGVRVPEEAAAALAALEGQEHVGRDLAGSLSQEEDESPHLVIPPPLFSPPSQLNNSGWFAEDADAAPPPFSPPSQQETPIGATSRAMSLSYVPPPDGPPPPEEDEEQIASPSTPPLDDPDIIAQDEAEGEDDEVDEYGSYSGRPFPPPMPSHGSFSSYESAAGLFKSTSSPQAVPVVKDDEKELDDEQVKRANQYGPRTPIIPPPPPVDDDRDDENESVLSPLDPPSDYVEEYEDEDEIVPPPSFPPPLSEGEEEDSRLGDTSGQSSTWGLPLSMQRYATTTANGQQEEAEPEDGGSSQASNQRPEDENDGDSLTDFDPFADSTDDIMSSPAALQVVLPPPLFSPEASSDEEEGGRRFANSSARGTHDSDDDNTYFDDDSAPPPPGSPPPLDESEDEMEKTKILEQPFAFGSSKDHSKSEHEATPVKQQGVVSPRRASVPPPAYAPSSSNSEEEEEEDDEVAPPPTSPPPPPFDQDAVDAQDVQVAAVGIGLQREEEDDDVAPPPSSSPPPFEKQEEDGQAPGADSKGIDLQQEDEIDADDEAHPPSSSPPPFDQEPVEEDDGQAQAAFVVSKRIDLQQEEVDYDDEAAAPPSSPPSPFDQEGEVQVQPAAAVVQEQDEGEMIVPPLASPPPSDDDDDAHVHQEEHEPAIQLRSSSDNQSPASSVPRVIEYDENDILPPPESPSSAEGDSHPSHSFFSGHLADTSAYVDEDDQVDDDEGDDVQVRDKQDQIGMNVVDHKHEAVQATEETDIPAPGSPPPESDEDEKDEGDDVTTEHMPNEAEAGVQNNNGLAQKDVSPVVVSASSNNKFADYTDSDDHVHVMISLSDDPSMSQIMMSEADSYLTNESSLSPNHRSPTRSYLATHQSMTSVAEEHQTGLNDESQSSVANDNTSSNGQQTLRSTTVMAGSASNVVVASRRVSDPPPPQAAPAASVTLSSTTQQQPIRIDLHVHEDCVMRIQRGAFVQVPKFRAKLYVGSPEAAASLTDVIVGPIAFHPSDESTGLMRLEPVGSKSHLMTTEASEGFQVTIPRGTPTNPPLQFGHYYTENDKVALPIKVACGVEFQKNQTTGGVMGHIIVKLVGNPNCGSPSEFLSMSVEVSLSDLVDCEIFHEGFKFSPPNARYNQSTRRVLWEPSPEPFALGVSQMFQAKFWCDRELPKQPLAAVVRFECKGVLYSNTDARIAGQEYKLRGVAKRTMFKVACLV